VKKILTVTLASAALLILFSESAFAIPAFARKYGFSCNMCHVAFPKLNDFGQRFRGNGYQIPGQAGLEQTVFETPIPIALRTMAGHSLYKSHDSTTSAFHLYGLDVLAAGVLSKNVSFFFVYTPRIDEPAGDYTGSGSGNNPSQLAAIESANVVFSNLVPDKLNLRVGRFEPAYQLLSSRRLYYARQSFETYGFTGSRNAFDFSANQIGVEATGRFPQGVTYAVGLVNGSGASPENNTFKDVYAVLSGTFGKGEGQSAGQRVGVFGYLGHQPTTISGTFVSPEGDTTGGDNHRFYRVGGSVSLNWKTLNLQALVFRGMDDNAFNVVTSSSDYTFHGGVVHVDWAGLPNNRLVTSAMYNWVRPPSNDDARKVDSYSALGRYYLGSWQAANVALHGEYTHRAGGGASGRTDNLFTLLFDFDF
jgi:hypothetical protein